MYFLGAVLLLAGAIWMTVNAAKKDGALAAIFCFICKPVGFLNSFFGGSASTYFTHFLGGKYAFNFFTLSRGFRMPWVYNRIF